MTVLCRVNVCCDLCTMFYNTEAGSAPEAARQAGRLWSKHVEETHPDALLETAPERYRKCGKCDLVYRDTPEQHIAHGRAFGGEVHADPNRPADPDRPVDGGARSQFRSQNSITGDPSVAVSQRTYAQTPGPHFEGSAASDAASFVAVSGIVYKDVGGVAPHKVHGRVFGGAQYEKEQMFVAESASDKLREPDVALESVSDRERPIDVALESDVGRSRPAEFVAVEGRPVRVGGESVGADGEPLGEGLKRVCGKCGVEYLSSIEGHLAHREAWGHYDPDRPVDFVAESASDRHGDRPAGFAAESASDRRQVDKKQGPVAPHYDCWGDEEKTIRKCSFCGELFPLKQIPKTSRVPPEDWRDWDWQNHCKTKHHKELSDPQRPIDFVLETPRDPDRPKWSPTPPEPLPSVSDALRDMPVPAPGTWWVRRELRGPGDAMPKCVLRIVGNKAKAAVEFTSGGMVALDKFFEIFWSADSAVLQEETTPTLTDPTLTTLEMDNKEPLVKTNTSGQLANLTKIIKHVGKTLTSVAEAIDAATSPADGLLPEELFQMPVAALEEHDEPSSES